MKVIEMRIRTPHDDSEYLSVIRAMLELYPIDQEVIREIKNDDVTDFVFHMKVKDLALLDHDIELLRICGYNFRKARS